MFVLVHLCNGYIYIYEFKPYFISKVHLYNRHVQYEYEKDMAASTSALITRTRTSTVKHYSAIKHGHRCFISILRRQYRLCLYNALH